MSGMRNCRRRFLAAAGVFLAVPEAVFAQQTSKMRRIGVLTLSVSSSEQSQFAKLQFLEWLRRAGFEEGRNVAVEWRYGEGDVTRLNALAEELVRLDVELICASFNDAIAAAKRVTQKTPIVMFSALSPVELGFVQSLGCPGGNVTGTAWSAPETPPRCDCVAVEECGLPRIVSWQAGLAAR